MTETASFTQVAHFGQATPSSATTAISSFPGKTLPPTSNTSGPSLSLHSHRQSHNSSKLPSFRFADIRNGTAATTLLPLAQAQKQTFAHRQQQQVAPLSSPSSANPLSDASPSSSGLETIAQGDQQQTPNNTSTTALTKSTTTTTTAAAPTTTTHRSPPPSTVGKTNSPPHRNLRTRASSYQTIQSPIAEQRHKVRRPASFPDSLVDEGAQSPPLSRTASTKNPNRRPPASRSSHGVATSGGPPPSLNTQRRQTIESISPTTLSPSDRKPSQEWTQGQRELLLPKSLSLSSSSDEIRRDQSLHRPPISYKPPVNSTTTQSGASTQPVRVPPIRSFRSSGSRKSLAALDMNFQPRPYDLGDSSPDANHDNTLRAVEGGVRLPMSPPASSRNRGQSGDDTGDVFLKIASEESTRPDDTRTTSTRANRSSHRRPLSTTVTSYHHPTSPPRISRRLSDQQDRNRSGRYDDDLASEVTRPTTYRPLVREKAASAHPGEDTSARIGASALRPSPMTPRSLAPQDQNTENSLFARRRPSVTDGNSALANRTPAHKAPVLVHGQTKTYNSSPLTRSFDFHNNNNNNAPETSNNVEGTESTTSTNAPSTVWDELDDLKSRIHRLELTGKLPSTSGAAVIRASEERPPTATTTVTTMSLSPKKSAAGHQTEATSTTSSQRDAHSNLHSALAKTKTFLNPDVYRALEIAANDALALSSLMGAPGQPGPISSAASVIGGGPGITDRQLRRRADSVCRSLTELCIALSEGSARTPAPPPAQLNPITQVAQTALNEGPVTPTTVTKSFGGLAPRPGGGADSNAQMAVSPRAMSKFEERRSMILNASAVPNPRLPASTPSTPNEALVARRSSLVVARTRRAGTEEPEDGRRSSFLLRSRRAGTEEPDEGRKTSFLVRNRRGTVGEDSDEARFRAPSRATTEVNSSRGVPREYPSDVQAPKPEVTVQTASALGRRRFISSNLHSSRLATPLATAGTPTRRYLERPGAEGDGTSGAEKPAETRISRHLSLSQAPMQGRSSSLLVRRSNRDSMIVPSSTAGTDGYR